MDIAIDGVNIFRCRLERAGLSAVRAAWRAGPGSHRDALPLDPLGDTFRLLYVDLRGQGRSQRVDPATSRSASSPADVTRLAEALGLRQYAVLGHSFGSFVALAHAIEQGGASHYSSPAARPASARARRRFSAT